MTGAPSRAVSIFWACWALIPLVAFIVMESYALATNWRNTLSANVWRVLRETPNEPVDQWSWLHFLAAGVYLVVGVWLFGHFFFMRWRS